MQSVGTAQEAGRAGAEPGRVAAESQDIEHALLALDERSDSARTGYGDVEIFTGRFAHTGGTVEIYAACAGGGEGILEVALSRTDAGGAVAERVFEASCDGEQATLVDATPIADRAESVVTVTAAPGTRWQVVAASPTGADAHWP